MNFTRLPVYPQITTPPAIPQNSFPPLSTAGEIDETSEENVVSVQVNHITHLIILAMFIVYFVEMSVKYHF